MEQHMEHLEEASSAKSQAFSSTFENANYNRQERKKGIPWTEEEHRLFLMGLQKYGKGNWRNISRNYVITRTPTQGASHAHKYYTRQLSKGKDKMKPRTVDRVAHSWHIYSHEVVVVVYYMELCTGSSHLEIYRVHE